MKWLRRQCGRAVAYGTIVALSGAFGQSVLAADTGRGGHGGGSADAAYPSVTDQRLRHAQRDNGWLMYRRSYGGQGFAPFNQINKHNVANLNVAFDYETGLTQGHEAAPLVNGRYMYITTPLNHVVALDATTGKVLWTYKKNLPKKALRTVCCGVVNRGVALYGNNVYMATLDAHVVALDAATGKVQWDRQLTPAGVGYSLTLAPLALQGEIIVGNSGGEFGARGFIEALNAKTGDKLWKTHTIPAPDQPGGDTWPKGAYKTGGGPAWQTGSYDKATDTLFWGVGNPAPWLATMRPGKNLYSNSVLALDPGTGKIKWYYQFTPHSSWDYDGNNGNVIADIEYHGKPYKAIVHADRNGWLYAIDRTNGQFIYAKPFLKYLQSVTGFKDGVARTNPAKRPTKDKRIFTCPSALGGKNWWPMSVDPHNHMAYVPTFHACMTMKGTPISYHSGLPYMGVTLALRRTPDNGPYGSVQAIDLDTGKQVWKYNTDAPWNGGMVSTGGGLVFSGSAKGYFYAFDADTGEVLWKSKRLSSGIIGVPTTYKVGATQYVAVYAGWGGVIPITMGQDKTVKDIPRGGHLYVFKLEP